MSVYGHYLPPGLTLRERTPADLAFLGELYLSSREEELRPVAWSQQQKRAFLLDQFDRQHAHYLQHYRAAQWLLIESEGLPIGRLYVCPTGDEIRLMDVTLVPQWRRRGTGTALLRGLADHADALGLPIGLHVEPFNPALRLYRRWGFAEVETRGVYLFMQRAPGAPRPR